ncbi:hypothetical protein AMEX_G26047, partial [Astyanax mexicanus]
LNRPLTVRIVNRWSFLLTSTMAEGVPSWKDSRGCRTIPWASGRWASAAVSGGVRVSKRRPRTTRPSPNSPGSDRGSPTPRESKSVREIDKERERFESNSVYYIIIKRAQCEWVEVLTHTHAHMHACTITVTVAHDIC